jgi:hypothetical protein
VLHDIAFGPVLEQPAGKDASPVFRAVIEHDQLDEGTGFLRAFPLCGAFAGAQADHRATDADALSGFQRDIADEAVALVEQAEHCLALFHRRHPGIGIVRAGRARLGQGPRFGRRGRRLCLPLAAGKQHRGGKHRAGQRGFRPGHGASGVHA